MTNKITADEELEILKNGIAEQVKAELREEMNQKQQAPTKAEIMAVFDNDKRQKLIAENMHLFQ